jgi:hypothetical protein
VKLLLVVTFLAAAVPATDAQARTVTLDQRGAPDASVSVPAGWRVGETRRSAALRRGAQRVALQVCPLDRAERDISGRHAAARFGDGIRVTDGVWGGRGVYVVPAEGGGCVVVAGGRAARRLAPRLHARLGPPGPLPASDAAAERLARAARAKTLNQPRATGTALAVPFGARVRIDSTWEWDLPAGYQHQVQRFRADGGVGQDEVVRKGEDNHVLTQGDDCWYGTSEAREDDALEPRLELHDWDAPPRTATAWRVSYAPPEPQSDGSTLVRWTGFVADGEALVGADGLLRSVRIRDHRQAVGRTVWRVVEVAFTGFPATIPQVTPAPECE